MLLPDSGLWMSNEREIGSAPEERLLNNQIYDLDQMRGSFTIVICSDISWFFNHKF